MKSLKNLLVPFIIMILLVISVIVYFAVEKFRNTEPSETSAGAFDVLYFNQSDIASLAVYNRNTGYSSLVNCSSDSDNNIIYSFLGDDAEPGVSYSQYKLYDYVGSLTSYYSSNLVSGNGNYADYGLDYPSYTLTINTVDGGVTKVYLGNKSPDGKYCYMFVEGSTDIYTVSSNKLIQAEKTAINFLDTMVLKIDYSDLKNVHFDRKSDGLSLDASVSVSGDGMPRYEIINPYNHPTSGYFDNMISKIVNLEITEFIDISGSELAKYGLDDPAFHFILTKKNGEKEEIYISRLYNDTYYGYVVGNDNYFKLNNYQIENVEMAETVLIDPYICYCYVKDVSSITGTYGDKSFKFVLDVEEGKNIMDDISYVTLDGRNAKISDHNGRSYCSILFESISCIKIGGVDTKAVVNTSAGPALTLSFIWKNYDSTEYAFYTRDDDSFYVFKDGEYMNFFVYSREIFNDGGSDTYSYGFWKAYELLNEAISGSINGVYDIPE